MEKAIKQEIKRLCRRMARRHAARESKEKQDRLKFEKRTGITAGMPKPSTVPPVHKHFDPAHCARNANLLAKTIWHKVLAGTYQPNPAVRFEIPKPQGGIREIMAFAIPDAALANVTLWRARERNLKRLSPFSYAYHPDRDVFDAILALKGFMTDKRLFAVQIDFKKYFDTIPTRYMEDCINDRELVAVTPHERFILREFMRHQYAGVADYAAGKFSRRHIGTPQGSSVSLLLANLANHELDRALERKSGRFVRYADDVVALCSSYSEAEEIEETFIEHCQTSGLVINEKKSPGIAIIGKESAELRSYSGFDYLGYRFTKDGLKIPEHVVTRIIAKMSRLTQVYLIHYPNKFGFNAKRCSASGKPYDWDLLGLILELRGYLYGGLEETEISDFLYKGQKLPKMRGLMGFYALLDDAETLKALDRWLVVNLRLAMRKRQKILQVKYGLPSLAPASEELILGTWLDKSAWRGKDCPDPRLPSFVRGWRAARKYYYTYGLEGVQPPAYSYY
jgi:RNA-directed DNA polymerase